ncbi:MAG: cobalt-precorrin-5B (C(1))-methyltransferase CbiD [Clostridia bacterium]
MKALREGYTTGSCAAAAALAACQWMTCGTCPTQVTLTLEDGRAFSPAILAHEPFCCGVIKDAGDDPDLTDGLEVIARVDAQAGDGPIDFSAGSGVGTVTRPGLKLPVGECAINPGPRAAIERAVRAVIGQRAARVTVSIPGGEALARRTFNPRLGIAGGLSVLGTTGVVRPMSEDALIESIELELSMVRAEGARAVLLAFGSQGEGALLKAYPGVPCVQVSNYVGAALDKAAQLGFEKVLLGGHAGKMTKVAAGVMNTHSKVADARREAIITALALAGAPTALSRAVYACQTTDAAIEVIGAAGWARIWGQVAQRAAAYCALRVGRAKDAPPRVLCAVLDSAGRILGESETFYETDGH